ncbi:MAG: HAD family hydrolase [Dongiaceae bacterium]
MTPAIRAVLFDKDGTLIDFRATWLPAYEAIVRRLVDSDDRAVDRLLSAGGYDRASGRIDPSSVLAAGTNVEIAALWAGLIGHDDVAALAARVNLEFMQHAETSLVPVTDLPALFRGLRQRGLRLGVATNDSELALLAQIQRLQIGELIDFFCGYDSGYGAKPGPGMVEAFARVLELPVAAIAVVGDSLHDLEMARAAGAGLTIGVLTGASPRETLAPHADHVIASIAEIESILATPPSKGDPT